MDNVIPRAGSGEVRKGYTKHAAKPAGAVANEPVRTLIEYAGVTGTRKLFAARVNHIYEVTSGTYTLQVGPLTTDYIQWVQFKNSIILVNGSDNPNLYDGTTWTSGGYTGVTQANLIDVTVYKQRLYFAEKNTAKFWYGATSAITGALTSFDVSEFLTQGGYIMFVSAMSHDTGSGLADYFIICSDKGEVLMYSGSNPATDFVLVGRFFIGAPLGRRAKKQVGSDLYILTSRGCISMRTVISGDYVAKYPTITDKISNAYRQAVESFSGVTGWEIFSYPRGNLLIINVPTNLGQGLETQFALSLIDSGRDGAWCTFNRVPAFTWSLFNDLPYFGASLYGLVAKFDTGYVNDSDLAPTEITFELMCSFNSLKNANVNKSFQMVMPFITGDVQCRNLLVAGNVDYAFTQQTQSTITGSGGVDIRDFSFWTGLNAFGRSISLRFNGTMNNCPCTFRGFQVNYEPGGII